MRKVLIVGGGYSYQLMFEQLGWEIVQDLDQTDLVQFTGGEDVSPIYYGETPHPTTHYNPRRDEYEAGIYLACIERSIPIAGICRGGQFLNVMNGGKLIQHVSGHAIRTTHPCHSELLGKKVDVTSTHHQMMVVGDGGYLDGWSYKLASRKETCPNGYTMVVEQPYEPEVIYYEETNCLCFQPHPEHYGAVDTRSYYFTCLNEFLNF